MIPLRPRAIRLRPKPAECDAGMSDFVSHDGADERFERRRVFRCKRCRVRFEVSAHDAYLANAPLHVVITNAHADALGAVRTSYAVNHARRARLTRHAA